MVCTLPHVRHALALGLCAVATASAACALIVGDVTGTRSFDAATTSGHEASADATRSHDAAEASTLSGHDGGSSSSGSTSGSSVNSGSGSSSSSSGRDAGHDACDYDATVGVSCNAVGALPGGGPLCDPRTSFCCFQPTAHCTASQCEPLDAQAFCSGTCGVALKCDDTADCVAAGHPNTVCCAIPSASTPFSQFVCLALAECEAEGAGHAVVCDINAPCACPSGKECAYVDSGLGTPTCVGL